MRTTLTGGAVNLALAAIKIAAGIIGASAAMVADGIHSLGDLASDLVLLVSTRLWCRPPDRNHPYGHGRMENLAAISVGLLLVGTGLATGYTGIMKIRSDSDAVPGFTPLLAALISIVVKEWLYRWTMKRSVKLRSPAMEANAWHHRADAFSSIPAFAAVSGAMLFPGHSWIDPAGALVVSVLIVQAAVRIIMEGLHNITDRAASPKLISCIKDIVIATKGVSGCHAIRSRVSGGSVVIDLHIQVDGQISVREGHNIAGAVETRILSECGDISDVLIHVEEAV